MNIHALRSFFFSSKRPDYPYSAVTQAPTPKNLLVAAPSKRWRRSRISRSRPHEHINLGLPFKRESRDLKQLTFVKATATIACEVPWIDNDVHRPSHSTVTSTKGVWVLVSQSTIVALQLCPQMNSLQQCFFPI